MADGEPVSGRGQLSRDLIVDRAVDLARREGLDRVSMRRLGRDLGVEPMSLYYYIPSKATLMVLMADRAVSALPDLDPTRAWDERLVELLVGVYRAGVDNPAVFPVLATEATAPQKVPAIPGERPASLAVITRMQELLAEANLPADIVRPAHRALIGLLVGLIVVQVDGLLPGPPPRPGSSVKQVHDIGEPAAADADPVQDLRFSVQLIVDGLKRGA